MYNRIIEILDSFFYEKWFLDSGSLLGIIRDGKFLKQDKGIDISVIINDYHSPRLEECVKQLRQLGFVISRYQWDGITFKYCLAPKQNCPIRYAIDLHLFRVLDGNFLCPQMKIAKECNKLVSVLRGLRKGNIYYDKYNKRYTGLLWKVTDVLYRDIFEYFGRPINMNDLTLEKDENIYKWVIPESMFRGTIKERNYGLNVLKDCNDYLKFRYADWRTPVIDWVTLRDDGGITHSSVNEIKRLLY